MARRVYRFFGAPVLAVLLVAGSTARAGEDAPPLATADDATTASEPKRAPPQPVTSTWCGWQIFAVDAAVAGLFAVSAKLDSPLPAIAGAVGYYAGGPLIRGLHGDGAGWSLLRRLTFPFAGTLLGVGVGKLVGGDGQHEFCSGSDCTALALGIIGGAAGAFAAVSYDWITAREAVPTETVSATWAPVVVVTPRMQAVGLALRF